VQAKVLRVLEEGRFERVGGSKTLTVDVRILAATNKDLPDAVDRGAFREDLYFRLNVVPIHVPALRERREDIPLLARHFLRLYCEREEIPPVEIDGEALEMLKNHEWAGNVRELRNTIERMVILSDRTHLTALDVPFEARTFTAERPRPAFLDARTFEEFKDMAEREFLQAQLERQGWNVQRTAKALEMPRSNLYKKIEKHGLLRNPSNREGDLNRSHSNRERDYPEGDSS
jgi:two-component system nitrogen regulation response regulator NtrX